MTLLALVPFIVFTSILLFSCRRHRKIASPGNVVIGLYCLTSFLALFLLPFYPTNFSVPGVLFYTFCIGISILPFALVDFSGMPDVVGPTESRGVLLVALTVAAFGTAAGLFWIPHVIRAFASGIGDYRNAMYTEDLLQTGQMGNFFFVLTGVWELAIPAAAYWWWKRGLGTVSVLLTLAALSRVFMGFAAGGRLGLMHFIASVIFVMGVFNSRAGGLKKYRGSIILGALFIGISGVLYSIWAADKRDLGSVAFYDYVPFKNRFAIAAFSVVHYAGQNLLNFQDFWSINWESDFTYNGGFQFPVVFGALKRLGHIPDYSFLDVINDFESRYEGEGLFAAVFCTFLRDSIIDFGWKATILISVALSAVTYLALRRYQKRKGFEDFLLVCFMANMPLNGWASNHLGNISGNGTIVYMMCAYLFLRVAANKKSRQGEWEGVQVPGVAR